VIEGHGRYLMPGLADMHVHLQGRAKFGDAPLLLAYGITTVLNLRGRPEILEWKKELRRIFSPASIFHESHPRRRDSNDSMTNSELLERTIVCG
jgi:hypothetical protein